MRKLIISITLVVIAMIVVLNSCKEKELAGNLPGETVDKLTTWIEKQKKPGRTFRNKKIQELKDNLELSKARTESLNSRDRVMLVPIRSNYRPGTKDDDKSRHVLLVFIDKAGKITRGNVVQIQDSASGLQAATPAALISDHFNSRKIYGKVRLAFLDAAGWMQYETAYEQGRLVSMGAVSWKPVTDGSARITCYRYTLTTTFYYSDGSTEVFVQDLGIVCEGNEIVQIPMPEESGGEPNPNGNCCIPDENIQVSVSPESQILSTNCTEYIVGGRQHKTCFYSWSFSTNTLIGYTWRFIKYQRAEIEKIDGVWKFLSLQAGPTTTEGQLPPCVSSDVTINSEQNIISPDGTTAKTYLQYTVSITITCWPWGSPIYENRQAMAFWVAAA